MLRFIVLFSCYVVLCVGHKAECGRNEEMQCVQSCPPQKTCRNRGIQFSCLQVEEPCHHECVCKPGFARNAVGDCITNEECDMCQGENEYFTCGSACDNECANLGTQNKTNCPILNIVCNRKCYCEDAYARDDKGNCIPIEECQPSCGENEEYTDCMKSCPPNTCLSLVAKFKCDGAEPCKKGCVCKHNFLRKETDSPCIHICQCDEMKNDTDCKLYNYLMQNNRIEY